MKALGEHEERVDPASSETGEDPAQARPRRSDAQPQARPPAPQRRFSTGIWYQGINTLLLTFGAVLAAVGFNLFLAPGDVAPGGITGLTLVTTEVLPFAVPTGLHGRGSLDCADRVHHHEASTGGRGGGADAATDGGHRLAW